MNYRQSKRTRLALITTISDIYVRGPRKLAAFLRMHGFDVTQIFMPMEPAYTGIGPHCVSAIPDDVVAGVLDLVGGCDVIGFSAMTDYLPMVRQLGAACRRRFPDKQILLGGVHAIQAPEYAIREAYLDAICTGEGELPTLELMTRLEEGVDPASTRGFWFRTPEGVRRNPRGDYVDLDALPFVDFDGGHIALDKHLEPVNHRHIQRFFGTTYWTDRSRGCPFHCAFCIHSKMAAERNNPVRWNSTPYFIAETAYVLDKYPWFNSVYFNDETFTAQSVDELSAFVNAYRSTIGLPFSAYVDPFSCSPEKADLLFAAGLAKIKMGIQSGCARIMQEYFDRSPNYRKIIELTQHIGRKWAHRRSLPVYDLITSVPWATQADIDDNFRNVAQFGAPYFCQVFTLSHYPGSKLFARAAADGLVDPENLPQQNHVATEPTLSNCLLQMLGFIRPPDALINWLIDRGLASSSQRMPRLFKFTNSFGFLRRAWRQILANDSTLMPFDLVRSLQRFGLLHTRPQYEQRAAARAAYLDGYVPPLRTGQDAILIDTRERASVVGSFSPQAPRPITPPAPNKQTADPQPLPVLCA